MEKVIAGIEVPTRHETAVLDDGLLAHSFLFCFFSFCLGRGGLPPRVVILLLRLFRSGGAFLVGWCGVVYLYGGGVDGGAVKRLASAVGLLT